MFMSLSNWLRKPERDLSLDRDCCRADVWRLGQERVDGVREAAGAALGTLRSISSDKGVSDAERARVMYALYKNRPIHIVTSTIAQVLKSAASLICRSFLS